MTNGYQNRDGLDDYSLEHEMRVKTTLEYRDDSLVGMLLQAQKSEQYYA